MKNLMEYISESLAKEPTTLKFSCNIAVPPLIWPFPLRATFLIRKEVTL